MLDAAFIAGCQRVEHYEITAFGSLVAWAKELGHSEARRLPEQNEREEKSADQKLSKIAASINPAARVGVPSKTRMQ